MFRRLGFVASGSAVLFLAACGGGGSASSSSSTLSITDFIAKANMICSNANASGAALPTPNVTSLISPNASDLSSIATYLASVVSVGQSLQSNLQNLGTPPSNQSTWAQALSGVQTEITDLQAAQAAAQSGNTSAYATAFTKGSSDSTAANTAFNSFGATGCAGGSSSSASAAPAAPTPT